MLKLASWNVNSLGVRLEQVLEWLQESGTDVLCLQETKLPDERFPAEAFEDLGYWVAFSGQKSWNGVAVISRFPLEDVVTEIPDFPDEQRRLIAVTAGPLRVVNLYVPNGAAPDTDKYRYKLDWLLHVRHYLAGELARHPSMAIVGDFNIAPEDADVHDPKVWEGNVLVTPAERDAFSRMLALGFRDSFRLFAQPSGLYSWWDYRAAAFRRNMGLRIDHVLLSAPLAASCSESGIDRMPRKHPRPSDHAPVFAILDIQAD